MKKIILMSLVLGVVIGSSFGCSKERQNAQES